MLTLSIQYCNHALSQLLTPLFPYTVLTPFSPAFHTAAGPATTTQQMRIPNDVSAFMFGQVAVCSLIPRPRPAFCVWVGKKTLLCIAFPIQS